MKKNYLHFYMVKKPCEVDVSQHVEGDSTKLAKDMKKIIMALLYIL